MTLNDEQRSLLNFIADEQARTGEHAVPGKVIRLHFQSPPGGAIDSTIASLPETLVRGPRAHPLAMYGLTLDGWLETSLGGTFAKRIEDIVAFLARSLGANPRARRYKWPELRDSLSLVERDYGLTIAAIREAGLGGGHASVGGSAGHFDFGMPEDVEEIIYCSDLPALRKLRQRQREDATAAHGPPGPTSTAPQPNTLAVPPPVKLRIIGLAEGRAVPGRAPDPTLDEQTYDDILGALSDYGRQMERSPSTYKSMGEEDIRNHLLALLQASFPSGSATGESFNQSGKTDILLRYKNHNLFVAECKVWSGASAFAAAITQLLGYLTWRDSKSALLVFVKNKRISKVLEAVRPCARSHPLFDGQDAHDPALLRFRFRLPTDTGVVVRMAVLAFHLP